MNIVVLEDKKICIITITYKVKAHFNHKDRGKSPKSEQDGVF